MYVIASGLSVGYGRANTDLQVYGVQRERCRRLVRDGWHRDGWLEMAGQGVIQCASLRN